MSVLPLQVVPAPAGGYNIVDQRGILEAGGYATKTEAEDDRKGLMRTYRENPQYRHLPSIGDLAMATTESKTPLQVTRAEAVHMFQKLGLQSCDKWDKKRMAEKLATLNDSYDREAVLGDDAAQATFNGVMTAIASDQGILCIPNRDAPTDATVPAAVPVASPTVAALTKDISAGPAALAQPPAAWADEAYPANPDAVVMPVSAPAVDATVQQAPNGRGKPGRKKKVETSVKGIPDNLPDSLAADDVARRIAPAEAGIVGKKAAEKKKKEDAAEKKKNKGALVGVNPTLDSHAFCAGVVLARAGLHVGVNDDMNAETGRLYAGYSNPSGSMGYLRHGWHTLRGFLATIQAEGLSLPTIDVPSGWVPPAALPTVEAAAKPEQVAAQPGAGVLA